MIIHSIKRGSFKVIGLAFVLLTYALIPSMNALAEPSATAYYPLAVGNSWTYCPTQRDSRGTRDCSTWTVQNEQNDGGGKVYAVWTYPSGSDDDAMILAPSSTAITELSSKHIILRTDKAVGESWEYPVRNEKTHTLSTDRFTIIEVSSCSLETETIAKCMTVEEKDSSLGIVVRTVYAENIGPIRYEYFHLGQPRPFSVLALKKRKLTR